MALSRLQIHHVRNLDQVELRDLGQVNVLYGANGSGKTSILEAIHLLGMAKSFRGNSVKSLISYDQSSCTVFGTVCGEVERASNTTPLGVQRSRNGDIQIKISGNPVRTVAELAEYLPIQVINADSFDLLTGTPGARRRYLDWGVFHVEHRFFLEWQRFQRCIKQRNKLLRRGKMAHGELAGWSHELASAGNAINDFRKAYLKQLVPLFKAITHEVSPAFERVELRFTQGWDSRLDYQAALESSKEADRDHGFTHVGPQRADFRVVIDGHPAADTLSRGQQKLVVCALKLAQGQLMADSDAGRCIYLVDDLPSELDAQHNRLVCKHLADMSAQVFITCVEKQDVCAVWPESVPLAMFHVEHGAVQTGAVQTGAVHTGNGSP